MAEIKKQYILKLNSKEIELLSKIFNGLLERDFDRLDLLKGDRGSISDIRDALYSVEDKW